MTSRPQRQPERGLSLVEVTVVIAMLGVLASMALPSYQSSLARARRAEAVQALTRLQLAQEAFRAQHGSYALAMRSLSGLAPDQPHFQVAMVDAHAGGYIARATAREPTPLNGGCDELSITVSDGQAVHGPGEHCWNR